MNSQLEIIRKWATTLLPHSDSPDIVSDSFCYFITYIKKDHLKFL